MSFANSNVWFLGGETTGMIRCLRRALNTQKRTSAKTVRYQAWRNGFLLRTYRMGDSSAS